MDEEGDDYENHDHDAAQAFHELTGEVSGVRRAVDRLSEVCEGNRPLDYGPDLGGLKQAIGAVGTRLAAIERHPALMQTPEQHRQAIALAGNSLMSTAAEKLDKATRDFQQKSAELATIAGTVRGKGKQAFWLIALPAMAALLTLFLSPILLSKLPWGFNTKAAAIVMNLDGDQWDAGWALMKAADPDDWQNASYGFRLVKANLDAIVACHTAAVQAGKDRRCVITIKG